MKVIDDRGRLFGRVNLFDAVVAAFVVVLIPIAYGTALLFRTAAPSIASVTRVEVTREERRVAGPGIVAKLKVKGSELRPMLRASIGATPAIGFVFENPNSADVLVGQVPSGTHDLILYDGVQEVARAVQAVTIEPTAPAHVRIVGTFVGLDRSTADSIQAGAAFPAGGDPQIAIVQVGPVHPDRRLLRVGSGEAEIPVEGRWARDAVATVRCDSDPNAEGCAVGGKALAAVPPPVVVVSGAVTALMLSVAEVLPDVRPRPAVARVRFVGAPELLALVSVGHRDATLDERAATVTGVGRLQTLGSAASIEVTLRLGVDAAGTAWSYRAHDLKIGAPVTFSTDRYVLAGSVLDLRVDAEAKESRP